MYLVAAAAVMIGWLVWAMQPPKLAKPGFEIAEQGATSTPGSELIVFSTERPTATPALFLLDENGDVGTPLYMPTNLPVWEKPTNTPVPTMTVYFAVTDLYMRETLWAVETARSVPTVTPTKQAVWIASPAPVTYVYLTSAPEVYVTEVKVEVPVSVPVVQTVVVVATQTATASATPTPSPTRTPEGLTAIPTDVAGEVYTPTPTPTWTLEGVSSEQTVTP